MSGEQFDQPNREAVGLDPIGSTEGESEQEAAAPAPPPEPEEEQPAE